MTVEGEKELLGRWLSDSAGAKCWFSVCTARKKRRVQDCFIACVAGLKGLPDAMEAVFPTPQGQLGIVPKARNSLRDVPWQERRAMAADLRAIYGATALADAEQALERFAERWDTKYPAISPSWLADWDRLTVLFDDLPASRRVIDTTNAIASLHYSLRKVLKGRGAFLNDEAIVKLLYMGLQHVAKKWTQPIRDWKAALNQFVMRTYIPPEKSRPRRRLRQNNGRRRSSPFSSRNPAKLALCFRVAPVVAPRHGQAA